jgi:hypothetical protein
MAITPKKSWELLEKVNQIAPYGHTVQKCRVVPVAQIELVRRGDNPCYYQGVHTCGSAWACPMCSPALAAEKAELLRLMHEKIPNKAVMITYTIQHNRGDKLDMQLDQLALSIRHARNGRRLARYRKLCLGYIRAYEILYGLNGWHSHFHEINYLHEGANEKNLVDTIMTDYKNSLVTCGKIVKDITCHLKPWHGDTDYLTNNWTIGDELVRGDKKTVSAGINILSIIDRATTGEGDYYGKLYNEYLRATHRRKLTNISKSLSRYQQAAQRLIDDEIEKKKLLPLESLAVIPADEYAVYAGIRGMRYEIKASFDNA